MKNVLTPLLYSLLVIPTVRTVLTVIYNKRNFTIKLFQNAQGFFLYKNTVYGANFYLSQIVTKSCVDVNWKPGENSIIGSDMLF